MVVGMNPGEQEDKYGRPFIGPAGRLLDSLFAEVGLDRRSLYITNAVKGRTPANREPTLKELKGCRGYLIEEFQAVRPRFALALGNVALRAIAGRSGIGNYRGREVALHSDFGTASVIATYHPSAALRYPKYRQPILEDLGRFKRSLEGTHTVIDVRYDLL